MSLRLSSGDTCQIWMWFRESNRYVCNVENIAYGENNKQCFCNPHPMQTYKLNMNLKCTFPQPCSHCIRNSIVCLFSQHSNTMVSSSFNFTNTNFLLGQMIIRRITNLNSMSQKMSPEFVLCFIIVRSWWILKIHLPILVRIISFAYKQLLSLY